jgi:hypothetical protein
MVLNILFCRMQEAFQSGFMVPPPGVFDMHITPTPRVVYRPSLSTITSSNMSGGRTAPHLYPIPRYMPHWQGQAQPGALPAIPLR